MYQWRKMSDAEREAILASRIIRGGSWRRPPLWDQGPDRYMLTAACYEHQPIIGASPDRMSEFEAGLLNLLIDFGALVHAHAVLPNHYHVLVTCSDITQIKKALGQLHGRKSFRCNSVDEVRGRKVFHGSAETIMKSERHFEATLNYIHHNPVKHGYVKRWQDWPYSSAGDYLALVGEKEARAHWLEYPVERYGDEWDQA